MGENIEKKLQEVLVSPEEWRYKVPENWVWVRMGTIGKYHNGRAFKSSEWTDKGRPIIRIQNLTGTGDKFNYFDGEVKSKYEVENGDFLISWSATLGAYIWQGEDAVLNQHIYRVETYINKLYHYYLVKSLIRTLYSKTHGSGMVHITKKKFKNTVVPLPPLEEQKRIVDKVESIMDKIKQARELIEQEEKSFKNRKVSILKKAFRGELTKKWRKENSNIESVEELLSKLENEKAKQKKERRTRAKKLNSAKEIPYKTPEEWQWKKIGKILNMTSGGTPSRKTEDYFNGSIPWLKTGEVCWNHINDSEEKITEEAINDSSAKLFPAGTVMVAMYGQGVTRGRAAILDIEASSNQAVCGLLPSSYIDSKFILYYFMEGYDRFRGKLKEGIRKILVRQ